ncbi:hypothetical protein [Novosphingobium sp.]|uniref:hypothetical protein n=1 Tax=Novosphingobium sp. TaxID=1874826 RepID=UPI003D6D2605
MSYADGGARQYAASGAVIYHLSGERNGREVTYRVTPDLARNAAEIMLAAIDHASSKP